MSSWSLGQSMEKPTLNTKSSNVYPLTKVWLLPFYKDGCETGIPVESNKRSAYGNLKLRQKTASTIEVRKTGDISCVRHEDVTDILRTIEARRSRKKTAFCDKSNSAPSNEVFHNFDTLSSLYQIYGHNKQLLDVSKYMPFMQAFSKSHQFTSCLCRSYQKENKDSQYIVNYLNETESSKHKKLDAVSTIEVNGSLPMSPLSKVGFVHEEQVKRVGERRRKCLSAPMGRKRGGAHFNGNFHFGLRPVTPGEESIEDTLVCLEDFESSSVSEQVTSPRSSPNPLIMIAVDGAENILESDREEHICPNKDTKIAQSDSHQDDTEYDTALSDVALDSLEQNDDVISNHCIDFHGNKIEKSTNSRRKDDRSFTQPRSCQACPKTTVESEDRIKNYNTVGKQPRILQNDIDEDVYEDVYEDVGEADKSLESGLATKKQFTINLQRLKTFNTEDESTKLFPMLLNMEKECTLVNVEQERKSGISTTQNIVSNHSNSKIKTAQTIPDSRYTSLKTFESESRKRGQSATSSKPKYIGDVITVQKRKGKPKSPAPRKHQQKQKRKSDEKNMEGNHEGSESLSCEEQKNVQVRKEHIPQLQVIKTQVSEAQMTEKRMALAQERKQKRAEESEKRRIEVQRRREEKRLADLEETRKKLEYEALAKARREEAESLHLQLKQFEEEEKQRELEEKSLQHELKMKQQNADRIAAEHEKALEELEIKKFELERVKRDKLIVSTGHKLKMFQRENERHREKQRLENIRLQEQKKKMLEDQEACALEQQRRADEEKRRREDDMRRAAKELEKRRDVALHRRKVNLDKRKSMTYAKYNQMLSKCTQFSYFVNIPKQVWELPIGWKRSPTRYKTGRKTK